MDDQLVDLITIYADRTDQSFGVRINPGVMADVEGSELLRTMLSAHLVAIADRIAENKLEGETEIGDLTVGTQIIKKQ